MKRIGRRTQYLASVMATLSVATSQGNSRTASRVSWFRARSLLGLPSAFEESPMLWRTLHADDCDWEVGVISTEGEEIIEFRPKEHIRPPRRPNHSS